MLTYVTTDFNEQHDLEQAACPLCGAITLVEFAAATLDSPEVRVVKCGCSHVSGAAEETEPINDGVYDIENVVIYVVFDVPEPSSHVSVPEDREQQGLIALDRYSGFTI